MKLFSCLLLLVLGQVARLGAQTTFVSNIDSTTPNGVFVYNTQWLARGFTTGANAGGYTLDSVNLFLTSPAMPEGTFGVSLWSDNAGTPGSLIGSFTSTGGGQYTWNSAGVLPASTTFWVAASSLNPYDSSGSYAWWFTNSSAFNATGGWTMLSGAMGSANSGASWMSLGSAYQFSVTASAVAVPEPSAYAALAGLLVLGLVVGRRLSVPCSAR